MSYHQTLPDIQNLSDNFISFLPNELIQELIQFLDYSPFLIGSGNGFSLILNKKKQTLYYFGNRNNEYGYPKTKAHFGTFEFVLIDSFTTNEIVFLSVGYNHAVLLDNKGQAYGFAPSRCLGCVFGSSQREATLRPQLIKFLSQENIVFVSCGCEYTIFLNDKGEAFSCGLDLFGEIGRSGVIREADNPIPKLKIPDNYKIIAVATGRHHSLFLTDEGKVLGCGIKKYLISIDTNMEIRVPELLTYTTKVTDIKCQLERSLIFTKEKLILTNSFCKTIELESFWRLRSNWYFSLLILENGKIETEISPNDHITKKMQKRLKSLIQDQRSCKDLSFTDDYIILIDEADRLVYYGRKSKQVNQQIQDLFENLKSPIV